MSSHSEAYEQKSKALKAQEEQLKSDLDAASAAAEAKAWTALKTGGIVIGALGIGYLTYRVFYRKKSRKPVKTKAKKAVSKPASGWAGRLSTALATIVWQMAAKLMHDVIKKGPSDKTKDS